MQPRHCGAKDRRRLFGRNPPSGQDLQSVDAQQDHQPRCDLANRLQLQLAATMVRAKRLDMEGERFACIGALNAARRIYVLVAKQ